jgi:PIN domain nuclease of toxin-antitoxin system
MGRPLLILLDTHAVIWLAQDQQRISSKAHDAIADTREGGHGLAVSSMTLLEIAQLASQQRIQLTPNLEAFLSEVERRFAVLPITGRICVQAFEFPVNYPKDPADRVIGATAVIEGLKLVTADKAIRQSKAVPTIW